MKEKRASAPTREGILIRPYSPFYGDPMPIGTKCEITAETDDNYTIKFPGRAGWSGSFSIKRCCVEIP
jgi:hypothetical protein